MAFAHTVSVPHGFTFPRQAARTSAPRQSLFSRVLHFIEEANMRRADREIARYMESIGGKFTDATEREIEQRYLSNTLR
jgi:hypothetical protein